MVDTSTTVDVKRLSCQPRCCGNARVTTLLKDPAVIVGARRGDRTYRCLLTPECRLKVVQRARRSFARELRKFVNHMHLVEVAKLLRDFTPRTARKTDHPVQHTL